MTENPLNGSRLIPVVVLEDERHAVPLAKTIVAGGLNCVEITLRTEVGLSAIRQMANRGDLLVGAGTVFTTDQAKAAVDHGARFIVSPGFSMNLVQWCQKTGVQVYPGCATPTDLQHALEAGLSTVKFFPAELMGGPAMLKTLSSVFRSMRFMPTGGITGDNIGTYLALQQVVACGGSWMVRPEWIRQGRFDIISQEIVTAVRIVSELPTVQPEP